MVEITADIILLPLAWQQTWRAVPGVWRGPRNPAAPANYTASCSGPGSYHSHLQYAITVVCLFYLFIFDT